MSDKAALFLGTAIMASAAIIAENAPAIFLFGIAAALAGARDF